MKMKQSFAEGLVQLNLNISAETQQKLLNYLELLLKWNKVYNLTAIRDSKQMICYHLIDSLVVLPYLQKGNWLDVGCGAGLPGLVLASARPEWAFTLIDSNSKKTSFVRQAAIELGLSNVEIFTDRVEIWNPQNKFNGIISRAFAETSEFIMVTRHLLAHDGRWAAMKGDPEQELKKLPAGIEIDKIVQLKVPKLNAARSLVMLKESK
jgi:16S rRNA (guanine527-N7)-methyltransferase